MTQYWLIRCRTAVDFPVRHPPTCSKSSRSNCRHMVSISHVLTTRCPLCPERRFAFESRGPYMANANSLPVESGCWRDLGKIKLRSCSTSTLLSSFPDAGQSSGVLPSLTDHICVRENLWRWCRDCVNVWYGCRRSCPFQKLDPP